jgi:hypothetical protein
MGIREGKGERKLKKMKIQVSLGFEPRLEDSKSSVITN